MLTAVPEALQIFLLVPVVGLAFGFRRKENGGDLPEEADEVFRSLVGATFDGVLVVDAEGAVEWADDGFCELVGCGQDEVDGAALTSFVDPSDAEKAQQYLGRAAETPQAFELRFVDQTGGARVLRVTTAPAEEGKGRVYVGVLDITDEENLKRRVAFTEKVDLLGRLMTGVGMDLRRGVKDLRGTVEDSGDPDARNALERLEDMERRLNAFPPRGIRGGAEVAIGEIAFKAVEHIEDLDVSSLSFEVEKDLPSVFGDAEQIGAALVQVARNALEAAAQNGGNVRLEIASSRIKRALPRKGFILPPGDYVQVTIKDTGPGIQPEILDHVFDPLFSTRATSPMAGLGLSAAYTIVKNHRGYIELESAQGTGTTVEIFFPRSRVREKMGASPAADTVEVDPTGVEVSDLEEAAAAASDDDSVPSLLESTLAEPLPEPEEIVEEPAQDDGTSPADEAAEEAVAEEAEMEALEEELAAAVEDVEALPDTPAEGSAPAAELSDEDVAALSGHETVLIIEEDAGVRGDLEEMLGQFGYNALPARNWVEGVDLFKRHTRLVNLVMLNIMVPEMVWVKTLMDLRKVAPQASVVLMGEGTRSHTVQRYVDLDGISYLEKPLVQSTVLQTVRISLDNPPQVA